MADDVARIIADLQKRIRALERGNNLVHASVPDYEGNGIPVAPAILSAAGELATALQGRVDAAAADGLVDIYYGPDEPEGAANGDFWSISPNDLRVWNAAQQIWVPSLDLGLGSAIAAAQNTADSKTQTFWSPNPPATGDEGDLWFDTDDKNKPYRYTNNAWMSIRDQLAEDANTLAGQANVTAISKARTFLQTNEPTGMVTSDAGDLWLRSSDSALHRWSGTAWVPQGLATQNYISSRGPGLVTNGSGQLGTNYNFPSSTFTPSDAPPGASGSFVYPVGVLTTPTLTERLPIDPAKIYEMSGAIRQIAGSTMTRFYFGLVPYDAYGLQIIPQTYMEQANTRTTLAAALNPGDTTVTLTSAANWNNGATAFQRSLIFWDYVDQGGKAWAPGTYSRNYYASIYNQGAISGNVITLAAPWAGPAKPAGTVVGNGSSGSNYPYAVQNQLATGSWVTWSGRLSGVHTNLTVAASLSWPIATAQVALAFLLNRTDATSQHAIANIQVTEVTVGAQAQITADAAATTAGNAATTATNAATTAGNAQTTASNAQTAAGNATTTANNAATTAGNANTVAQSKNATFFGSATPTALGIGDIWFHTGEGNKQYRWNGASWAVVQDQLAVDANTAAGNANTLAGTKNRTFYAGTAPTGLTAGNAGDVWYNTADKNQMYRWSGTAWVSVRDVLASDANTLAGTANNTAISKSRTFYASTAPTGMVTSDAGDLWFDTANGNRVSRWSATAWVLVQDSAAAKAAADAAAAIADGKITSYYQTAAPTGLAAGDVGDLWYDTDDKNRPYRWSGTTWVDVRDVLAADANSLALTKVRTFYSATQPTGMTTNDVGDIWFATTASEGLLLYRWSGVSWVPMDDSVIRTENALARTAGKSWDATGSFLSYRLASSAQTTVVPAAGPVSITTGTNVNIFRLFYGNSGTNSYGDGLNLGSGNNYGYRYAVVQVTVSCDITTSFTAGSPIFVGELVVGTTAIPDQIIYRAPTGQRTTLEKTWLVYVASPANPTTESIYFRARVSSPGTGGFSLGVGHTAIKAKILHEYATDQFPNFAY